MGKAEEHVVVAETAGNTRQAGASAATAGEAGAETVSDSAAADNAGSVRGSSPAGGSGPARQARAATSPAADATPDLDVLLKDLQRLEEIVEGWDDSQRSVLLALRKTLETLHREALRHIIAEVKQEPAAMPRLRAALADPLVYAVLRHFGLVRASLQERVEQALERVRPMLAAHGGDVELLAVEPPDTVKLRLLGACDGCPASGLTLTAGVEKAIREACPEITRVECVSGLAEADDAQDGGVRFVSPFALQTQGEWLPACRLNEIPDGGMRVLEVGGHSLILSRNGTAVSCFSNACAHLAMPMDGGLVEDGILTCPHHGFRYDLRTGECLTVPEVQLQAHAVRVVGDQVEVLPDAS